MITTLLGVIIALGFIVAGGVVVVLMAIFCPPKQECDLCDETDGVVTMSNGTHFCPACRIVMRGASTELRRREAR